MNGSSSDPLATILLLVQLGSLYISFQDYSLHQRQEARQEQQYKDEKREKSRPRVHVIEKGEHVELTIQSLDAAGFYKTETFTKTFAEWREFLRELRLAPPVPRN
jgi:hypothetical protein